MLSDADDSEDEGQREHSLQAEQLEGNAAGTNSDIQNTLGRNQTEERSLNLGRGGDSATINLDNFGSTRKSRRNNLPAQDAPDAEEREVDSSQNYRRRGDLPQSRRVYHSNDNIGKLPLGKGLLKKQHSEQGKMPKVSQSIELQNKGKARPGPFFSHSHSRRAQEEIELGEDPDRQGQTSSHPPRASERHHRYKNAVIQETGDEGMEQGKQQSHKLSFSSSEDGVQHA